MDFKRGADIVSSDGDKVGTLKRVVLDPKTKLVKFLVMEKGVLFTEDKLVPIDFVEKVSGDRVELQESKESLDKLNKFEETHYVPLGPSGDNVEAYYWYPPLSGVNMGGYPLFPEPVYIEHTETNIPENYVAVKEGARVITEDGQHVGNLERIITDTKTDHVTHLVISSGLLLRDRKLVPAHWLADASGDEVHLSVNAEFLERLPEFQPDR